MTTDSERIETLRSYEISDSAARAYLALLRLGTTEAREVARLSGIPTSKIYHVLDYLLAKGLCQVFPESPKRFAPVPFGGFLDARSQQLVRAVQAIERERGALEARFRLAPGMTLDDRGRFLVLSGRGSILEKERALLTSARREALLVCTPGRILRMRQMMDELESLHARGVRIRMILPCTTTWPADRRDFGRLALVRVRDHPEEARSRSVAYVAIDRTDVLVVDHVPDDGSLGAGHDAAVHVQQQGAVSALCDLLESLWTRAPIRPKRASVLGKPRGTA